MNPGWPRLMVTALGWIEEKCWARIPSFNAKTDSGLGLCKPSGHCATDLSKIANIFFSEYCPEMKRWKRCLKRERKQETIKIGQL